MKFLTPPTLPVLASPGSAVVEGRIFSVAGVLYYDTGALLIPLSTQTNRALHTGTQSADTVVDGTTNKAFTAAEKTKLAGIASGATNVVVDASPTDGSNNAVSSNGVFDALALKAPLASPALTGNPTAPTQSTGDNSTRIATTAYVHGLIAALDVARYLGAIDASSNPNYPAADAGHIYRFTVAGKIGGASGINVAVGDLMMCNADGSAAGNQATVGSNWNIFEMNLDGAVLGPSSAVNNRVVFFDGTSGKLIKDSGLTLSGINTGDQTSVTGNSGTATALQNSRNIDGQAFNGTADITVIAPGTNAATSKTTPVDADALPLVDSAASNTLKKLTWANLKATAKTYFDSLYQTLNANLTGLAALSDPNADRILFWDDSAGAYAYLTAGSGLSISSTTLSATAVPVVTVQKTSNESRNNTTTLAADSTLTFAMAANTTYRVRVSALLTFGNTPDFKWGLSGPASPTRIAGSYQAYFGAGNALNSASSFAAYPGPVSLVNASSTTNGLLVIDLLVANGSNAGTFSFDWAQDTSGAIGVSVNAGSWLEYSVVS